MVQALLAGRKTQTRRGLTRLLGVGAVTELGPSDTRGYDWHFRDRHKRWHDLRDAELLARLPWQVGDRLWVKETWRTLQKVDCLKPIHLAEDRSKVTYEADPENRNPLWAFGKQRVSIHMPRWASRLTLLVTEVRVERLNDISEADAIDEGALTVDLPTQGAPTEQGRPPLGQPPSQRFRHLWNSINGPDAWAANPWVVAVSFTVHARNIDQLAPIAEAAE
jgi:hypothetical protein